MYTLKIRWVRWEVPEKGKESVLADETTLFILADEVHSHGLIKSDDEMNAWESGSYFNYRVGELEARLIEIQRNGKSTWYLASHAWLLGPDGKTIERLI